MSSRIWRRVVPILCAALAAAAAASAAAGHPSKYPASLVVIGGGDAVGVGADAAHPYRDAPADSWVTGTNPAVNSIYSRVLATDPSLRGHAYNLSSDDTGIDDLGRLVAKTVALSPKPQLVIVDIDGDVQCDGKDSARVADFGTKLGTALTTLSHGDPGARIFVVSYWGSFSSYVQYLRGLPLNARLKHAGKSLCQFVSAPSGTVELSHVAYVEKFAYAYDAQLKAQCAKVPNCRYDGGAAQRLDTTAGDLNVTQEDLSEQGQAKLAETEWAAMSSFVSGF
ncbi:MAG TPA: hypothetical protein VKR23_08285 [Gaiellaceae bacterium]|nr:hypothetical protein [Gaiellaceae bacterium]